MLSGYRLMWMTVMFDLPVLTPEEHRAASQFRLTLKDMGFEMAQYSVYMRFCTSYSQFETYCKRVEKALPEGGNVNILQFTDKQYEKIISYHGRSLDPPNKNPTQFALF